MSMRHHQMAEDFPKLPEQLSPLPCSASDTHLLISFLYQPLSSFTDPRPVLFSRCQTILSCHVLCRFEFKPLEMSLSWQPNCSPSLGARICLSVCQPLYSCRFEMNHFTIPALSPSSAFGFFPGFLYSPHSDNLSHTNVRELRWLFPFFWLVLG